MLIPVLERPHRVEPLVDSLAAAQHPDVPAHAVFICSPGDLEEIDAVELAGARLLVADWEPGRGDYAKKMNHAWRHTGDEWVFFAADDVVFRAGWLEAALAAHEATGACVIGTNDLGNAKVMAGRHSTHTLVHRDYQECGTIDDGTVILHEGYWHNWVDNELVETAEWRGTFAAAPDSHVEHLHPFWHKARPDDTYARGQEHYTEDRNLFQQRRRLWAS